MRFSTLRWPFAAAFSLLLLSPAISQELVIKPKWKAGETRTVWLTEVSKSYEDGVLTEEKEERLDAKVKVMSEDAERIMLEVDIRNAMLKQFMELSDKLGAELDPWKRLILRYRIDKNDGSTTLFNWEDVSERILSSYEQVRRSIRKTEPEMVPMLDATLTPIIELYRKQEVVESLFANQLNFLTACLYKPLNEGKPLETVETAGNPFDPSGPQLTMNSTYHLDAFDRENGRATVRIDEKMDTEAFRNAMRAMMESVVKSMAGDKMTKQQQQEMDSVLASMVFDLSTSTTITMDTNKGWPVRSVHSTNGSYSVEGRKGNTETTITAEVR
ncbi:MAG: hypothetical protein KF905_12595 [Flavobacteriales bacterium]|nr:hypothetical protein [Flavobacteriales bacterium]